MQQINKVVGAAATYDCIICICILFCKASQAWRRRPKDREYTLDFAATLGGKLVAGKRLYHPVKCTADAKLGALARGMAQGHNSMETMSTPRQDMLVGALEGFLEDLPSS